MEGENSKTQSSNSRNENLKLKKWCVQKAKIKFQIDVYNAINILIFGVVNKR